MLPEARRVGVSEELRGWNYREPPMRPPKTGALLPNYLVASRYCPTSRDVYLSITMGIRGEVTEGMRVGTAIHAAVRGAMESAQGDSNPDFGDWWRTSGLRDDLRPRAEDVWRYTRAQATAAIEWALAAAPFSSRRDAIATALPFLVEHRIDGSLIGLSRNLALDAYDYLRGIVFDLKYLRESSAPDHWRRLYAVGYAVAIESIYEVPVDVGCVVYVSWSRDRMRVMRDLFFIGDDLRSEWLEQRDLKAEIVASRRDPGIPPACDGDCPFMGVCGGRGT